MSILKNNKVIAVGDVNTYHPPILSCMWSDHIINDIQWLRADTFSWQDGDVYKTVYDKLVEEVNNSPWDTHGKTVDGVSYRHTDNGFKIATYEQESNVLNKYNTDGIAWYYILDTTNKRFKLPRTKYGFEGLRTNAGDDIAESLPNINIGNAQIMAWYNNQITWSQGALVNNGSVPSSMSSSSEGNWANTGATSFDASYMSSTYKDNAPVQERATQMYLYFYVGEFAQTSIEQTAGLNAELFNGKMDLSLLQVIYPVGSIYLSVNSTCPLAGLFGTWERVAEGKALWTGNGSNGGTTISAGLPNITGNFDAIGGDAYSINGAFFTNSPYGWYACASNNAAIYAMHASFNASRSSSIYGNSTTVQPPSYVINAFRRVS